MFLSAFVAGFRISVLIFRFECRKVVYDKFAISNIWYFGNRIQENFKTPQNLLESIPRSDHPPPSRSLIKKDVCANNWGECAIFLRAHKQVSILLFATV